MDALDVVLLQVDIARVQNVRQAKQATRSNANNTRTDAQEVSCNSGKGEQLLRKGDVWCLYPPANG
jgi:hypothetical protein